MYKWITIIILFGVLLPNISFNVDSEPLQDFYSDKKTFNYMDMCNIYPTFNLTDNRQMCEVTDHEDLTSYEALIGGTDLIPHKTIYFTKNYPTDSILLITKMVYNFTSHDEFSINLYYNDTGNNSVDLVYFYNDYITSIGTDNITHNYSYVTNGLKEYSSVQQSVFQRHSLLKNSYSGNNLYDDYRKRVTVDNGNHWLKVLNVTIKNTVRIKTNTWTSIKIKKDNFLWNNSVFNSFNFINFGISKVHKLHEILINGITIDNRFNQDGYADKPFTEYYEFKEITTNTSTNRTIFSVDLVSDNYQNLIAYPLEMGLSNSNHITLDFNHNRFWNSTYPIWPDIGNYDYSYFVGYQINIQRDSYGHYHIYLYYKYHFNTRLAMINTVQYNYSFVKVSILNDTYAYLCNFEYYDNMNNTDIDISYVSNSHKWDIIDNAIRYIDRDEEHEVLLVQNIDSSGFTVPSIEDLKKAFTDKIVNPLTSTLNTMKDTLSKPLNAIDEGVSALSGKIDSISSTLSGISSSISGIATTVTDGFSDVAGYFSSLESHISTELTTINSAIGGVTSAVGQVKSAVDLVTTAIQNLQTVMENVKTSIDNIHSYMLEFSNQFSTTVSQLGDILTSISVGGIIWTMINDIIDDIQWIVDSTTDLMSFLSDVFSDLGTLLLDLWDLTYAWLVNSYDAMSTFLEVTWMIMGTVFLYRLIFALQKFSDSGNMADIYEVLEVFYTIATFIFTILRVIIQFIGGIIP